MKISFEVFKNTFIEIITQKTLRDKYLESIPRDIEEAFFDNAYANSLACVNDVLVRALFDEASEDVIWAIWECKFKGEEIIVPSNIELPRVYKISSVDDYLEYVKKEFDFNQD